MVKVMHYYITYFEQPSQFAPELLIITRNLIYKVDERSKYVVKVSRAQIRSLSMPTSFIIILICQIAERPIYCDISASHINYSTIPRHIHWLTARP